jgi:ATP-dependent DNA helicase DinG
VVDQDLADALAEAGDGLAVQLGDAPVGRWDVLPGGRDGGPAAMLAAVRDACAGCRAAMGGERREEPDVAIARRLAVAALEEVHGMAERVLRAYAEADPARRPDVIWLADEERRGRVLRAAPLSVAGLLRDRLFGRSTVVLTSATLALGGSFDALARQWGLPPAKAATPVEGMASAKEPAPDAPRWTGTDVGSPFEHGRSAILYVAKHLPVPGRDGLPESYLDEIEQLITAAGGRALGLFSSMRAAKRATEVLRDRLDVPVLCQGDDSTALLVRRFAEDEATCLFGTLSLWQGVDVPGPALQLVIVDRIPFPRPDDPLMAARQRAVDSRGGNGFLTVAATHAALLLAQGTGRLLRSTTDRGVIAVLDPRLATARYGGFLRASLPPYWQTTDPEVVRAALRRLASGRATAPAPTGVPSAAGG